MVVLDRVPIDRIQVEARDVQFARMLLKLLLGLFYAVGWVAGKVSVVVAVAWTAVKLGWVDARKPTGRRGSAG
jgi:hypothetical protein